MTADVLEYFARNIPRCSPSTRQDYLQKVAPFVAQHPEPALWTDVVADAHLEQLLAAGYKPASADNVGDILKVLYRVHNRPRLYLRRRCTARAVIDQARPALTLDEFGRLIRVALRFPFPEVRSLVAVATVYGARRGELASLQSRDIDLTEGRIVLATLKREDVRVHQLPAVLQQVIDPAHFVEARSPERISLYWPPLERLANIPDRENQGWHAPRRALSRLFPKAGIPNEVADAWMGWAVASRGMGARYRMEDRTEMDRVVFERHPIVPIWEAALQEVRRAA